MADHYGTMLSACRPYKPQEKGKVESGIKYVKNNFFAGREFKNNEEMNCQLRKWQEKANDRIHGTTKEKPIEMYINKEKEAMLELPGKQRDCELSHAGGQEKATQDATTKGPTNPRFISQTEDLHTS